MHFSGFNIAAQCQTMLHKTTSGYKNGKKRKYYIPLSPILQAMISQYQFIFMLTKQTNHTRIFYDKNKQNFWQLMPLLSLPSNMHCNCFEFVFWCVILLCCVGIKCVFTNINNVGIYNSWQRFDTNHITCQVGTNFNWFHYCRVILQMKLCPIVSRVMRNYFEDKWELLKTSSSPFNDYVLYGKFKIQLKSFPYQIISYLNLLLIKKKFHS